MSQAPSIIREYATEGSCLSWAPLGNGYINKTYLGTFASSQGKTQLVFQQINTKIFKDPVALMNNILLVIEHVKEKKKSRGETDERGTLEVCMNRRGEPFTMDEHGEAWRCFKHVERCVSFDILPADKMETIGRAFGQFHLDLSDFDARKLVEVLPDFHNTPFRLRQFEQALAANAAGRCAATQTEIKAILDRKSQCAKVAQLLGAGKLRLAVVHNDPKVNNVLFDKDSGQVLCVIDLDTVMPGTLLYDFGDLVRSSCNESNEDETDLGKIKFNLQKFSSLCRGYLSAMGKKLTADELKNLAFSARLITLEQSMRFLGDYLNGDTYYKTTRPGQNLDRARNQLHFLKEMEKVQDAMEKCVAG